MPKASDASGNPAPNKVTATTTFTLVSQMVGASLLSLPYVYTRVGFILIAPLMVFSVIMSLYCILYTAEVCYYTGANTVRALTAKIISKKLSYILDASLIFVNYGYLTSYIIISSQAILTVMNAFKPEIVAAHKWINYIFQPILLFGVMFPLSLLKSIRQLASVASVSIFLIFVTAASIAIYCFIALARNRQICPMLSSDPSVNTNNETFMRPAPIYPLPAPRVGISSTGMGVLYFISYIPMLQGFFSIIISVPAVLAELKGPYPVRRHIIRVALYVANVFVLCIFLLVGYTGAAMFGLQVKPNVLASFSVCKDYYISVVTLLYAIVVCIAYPLIQYPLKVSLMDYFHASVDTKKGYLIYIGFSLAFAVLCLALGMAYSNISGIFGLFTALFGIFMYFLIPMYCHYILPQVRAESTLGEEGDTGIEVNPDGTIDIDGVGATAASFFLPGTARESIARMRKMSMRPGKPVDNLQVDLNPVTGEMRAKNIIGAFRGRTYSVLPEHAVLRTADLGGSTRGSDGEPEGPRAAVLPPRPPLPPGAPRGQLLLVGSIKTRKLNPIERRMSLRKARTMSMPQGARRLPRADSLLPRRGSISRAYSLSKQTNSFIASVRKQSMAIRSRLNQMSLSSNRQESTLLAGIEDNETVHVGDIGAVAGKAPDEVDETLVDQNGFPLYLKNLSSQNDPGSASEIVPAIGDSSAPGENLVGVLVPEFMVAPVDKQKERAKMTRGRKIAVWVGIGISGVICAESVAVNIMDFAGYLNPASK